MQVQYIIYPIIERTHGLFLNWNRPLFHKKSCDKADGLHLLYAGRILLFGFSIFSFSFYRRMLYTGLQGVLQGLLQVISKFR